MALLPAVITPDILDPGNDLGWTFLQEIFPITVQPDGTIGQTHTIMGDLVSFISVAALTLMICWAVVGLALRVFSTAETGRFFVRTNGIMPIRVALAFMLAIPNADGFSVGQLLVTTAAKWGVGIGAHAFAAVIDGIGPNATPIYVPIIPGSQTIITGLAELELCRQLVNLAANNPAMMPVPTPITGGVDNDRYTTWAYRLTVGNATDAPACGTITIHQTTPAGNGVVDLTAARVDILEGVMAGLQGAIAPLAEEFWTTHDPTALAPMQGIITTEANAYTDELTAAASEATAALRAAFPNETMRAGGIGTPSIIPSMEAGGWTLAPAWYLEMGKLNGEILSALTATPMVAQPSLQGFGALLSQDLAPLITVATAHMTEMLAMIATTDRVTAPSGYGDITSIQTPSMDGLGVIERIARSMNITDRLIHVLLIQLSPISTDISDPFAQLMGLGHFMVTTALAMYGLALILGSTVGTAATAAWATLTFNFGGAIATVVGHLLFQSLTGVIFFGIMLLLGPGMVLGYLLPILPVSIWLFGIANWLIRFILMIYGVPFWLFAHLTMNDDSIVGRGLQGWIELVALFMTPVLMIAGLMSGYVLFSILVWLETLMFYVMTSFILEGGWLVINALGMFAILAVFVLMIIASTVACFRLITILPQFIINLLGSSAMQFLDSHAIGHDVALVASAAAIRNITSGVSAAFESSAAAARIADSRQAGAPGGLNDPNVESATNV